jgi:hypothetical protein
MFEECGFAKRKLMTAEQAESSLWTVAMMAHGLLQHLSDLGPLASEERELLERYARHAKLAAKP